MTKNDADQIEYIIEFSAAHLSQEPLNNPEFLENLKDTLKNNGSEFSIKNIDGNREKYKIKIIDSISDLGDGSNNVALFQMDIQNSCVRLKQFDILNNEEPDDHMTPEDENKDGGLEKTTTKNESTGNEQRSRKDKGNIRVIDIEDGEESTMSLREMQQTLQKLAEQPQEHSRKSIKSNLSAAGLKPNTSRKVSTDLPNIVIANKTSGNLPIAGNNAGSLSSKANANYSPKIIMAGNSAPRTAASSKLENVADNVLLPMNCAPAPCSNIAGRDSANMKIPPQLFTTTAVSPNAEMVNKEAGAFLNISPPAAQPKAGLGPENETLARACHLNNLGEKQTNNANPVEMIKNLMPSPEGRRSTDRAAIRNAQEPIFVVNNYPVEKSLQDVGNIVINQSADEYAENGMQEDTAYASESEVANMINDLAKAQLYEDQHSISSGMGSTNIPSMGSISSKSVKKIKNDAENVVIHITMPEKSEFEVILHRGDRKNKSEIAQQENADGAADNLFNNEQLGISESPNTSDSFSMTDNPDEYGIGSVNEESIIDETERPDEGQVKRMIEFYENLRKD
ncbi:uncharacterized protein VICG_00297 [Vittaforma corneae ATCC 50505]|uniref:Uncharacterized protein n=1 Tax=Vittaforma corneae (strain ATCC 50505) TaxID=993615 RepID=L2GPW9_VITCO|nr:uncharacterized protein VICG_00297 [Vittaforma corneae ATCC 50505]ELA42545.1 hypothetical protein VICG_00297 [Vittaforma corneae ATCC 50505]